MKIENFQMRCTRIAVLLMTLLLFLAGCTSNPTPIQQQQKQVDWGTIDTIERESVPMR